MISMVAFLFVLEINKLKLFYTRLVLRVNRCGSQRFTDLKFRIKKGNL